MSEPTIYKPGAYNTPGVYKGAGGIYNGRGVYNDSPNGIKIINSTAQILGRTYTTVKYINSGYNDCEWTTLNLDYKDENISLGGSLFYDEVPRAYYYNNDENTYGWNGLKYGLLYNIGALLYIETLLSNGWNVPGNNDYQNLLDICGQDFSQKLKKDSGWSNPGTNEFKWNALPSGIAIPGTGFSGVNIKGQFYSKTKTDEYYGILGINNNDSLSDLYVAGGSGYNSASCRLVRYL